MLHTPARIGAGTAAGGQFAVGFHPESAVLLEEPPTEPDRPHPGSTVLVTDVMGDEYLLTPGVIDDDAEYVFRNGQCLALAVAVSRRTGWPIVLTCFDIPERFQLGPDHHPDLVHATVRTPEGELLDIRGPNDPDVREMDGRHDVEWPADQVDALMAAYDVDMETQLLDVADTFVDPVLALREQELEATAAQAAGAVVLDSGGYEVRLTPGVIDEEAQWVYLHGQCLALAAAGSRETGWPVAVLTERQEEPDALEPSGFACTDLLVHAYLVAPDGRLLDITGAAVPDVDAQQQLTIHPADQIDALLTEHRGYLERQDEAIAATFLPAVLAAASISPTYTLKDSHR